MGLRSCASSGAKRESRREANIPRDPNRWFYVLVAVAVAATAAAIAVGAFAPFGGDATASNLPLARIILTHGMWARDVDLPESFLPHNWEYLLALATLAGGERGVSLLTVGALAALLATIYTLARTQVRAPEALLAVGLFLICDEFVYNLIQPKADACASALALGAAWAAVKCWQGKGARYFGYAVLLGGLAVGTKLSLAVSAAPIMVFAYVGLAKHVRKPVFYLAAGAAAAVALAALTAPWWAVNWRLTGNPLFPYAHGLWGGEPWVPTMVFGEYSGNILRRVTLPFYLAIAPNDNGWRINAAIPAFFIVGLIAYVRDRERRPWLWLGAALYAGYVIFSGRQEPRYFIPLIITFAVLAASGVAAFVAAGGWRRAVAVVLTVAASAPFLYDVRCVALRAPAALGIVSKENYFPASDFYLYHLGAYVRAHLPAGSTIVSLWNRNAYYVPARFVTYRSPLGYVLHGGSTPRAAEETLLKAKAYYILSVRKRVDERGTLMADDAFRRRLVPVYAGPGYTLYKLRVAPP